MTPAGHKSYEEELKRSEDRFKLLFDNTPDAIFIADIDTGIIIDANPSASTLLMRPKEEIIGMHQSQLHPPEVEHYSKETFTQHVTETRAGMPVKPIENKVLRADGTYVWVEINAKTILMEDKEFILGVFRDISKRRKALDELDTFFNMSHDMMCIAGTNGYFKRINPMFEKILGFTEMELLSRPFIEFVHPDDRQKTLDEIARLSQGIPSVDFENRYECTDGQYIYLSWVATPQAGLIYATARNITEKKKAEDKIRLSLKEKDLLLGEIHHRVKNNLTVISSLLRMQSYSIDDATSLRIFRETENRISSISAVHEMLYRCTDMTSVDVSSYIDKLIRTLYETYVDKLSGVRLITDVDKVSLGIDLAIPCGLMINELLTNAAKYAFPDGGTGQIYIALHPSPDGTIELIVADDGVGIPKSLDIWHTPTLGWQLITGIATTQLGGELELNGDKGTQIKVRFRARQEIDG
ncbi:MAG: PAS domain S-box protein [Nitrospirae bacterium]|nr:PAS domain S-box protein [Nitrospirota bacterium]